MQQKCTGIQILTINVEFIVSQKSGDNNKRLLIKEAGRATVEVRYEAAIFYIGWVGR